MLPHSVEHCVAFLFVFICIYIVNEIFNVDIVSAGLAVITVMFVTTLLMFLIISAVWKKHVFLAFLFVVELSYFDACLAKLHKGGWFPLVVSAVVSSLMSIWHYGTIKKQTFELENKVSLDCLLRLGTCMGIAMIPGVCLVYSHVTSGVPPMFAHFVTNFPAFHQILIFVTIQSPSLIVPKVPDSDRLHVSRIGPPELPLFRCIVR